MPLDLRPPGLYYTRPYNMSLTPGVRGPRLTGAITDPCWSVRGRRSWAAKPVPGQHARAGRDPVRAAGPSLLSTGYAVAAIRSRHVGRGGSGDYQDLLVGRYQAG